MSLDDLGNYRDTKVAGTFSKLAEANKGKGPLDPQEEYIFELVDGDIKQLKTGQSKEDKAAGKEPQKKKHFALTWKETKTGILVFQKLQVETISWGKGPADPFRSRVIRFLEDIGIPVPEGKVPAWGSTFIKSMKIRARVVQSSKNGQPVPDEYVFKEGSFRKFQA